MSFKYGLLVTFNPRKVSDTQIDVVSRSSCEIDDRIVKKNLPLGDDVSILSDKLWKVIPFLFILSIDDNVCIVLRLKRDNDYTTTPSQPFFSTICMSLMYPSIFEVLPLTPHRLSLPRVHGYGVRNTV